MTHIAKYTNQPNSWHNGIPHYQGQSYEKHALATTWNAHAPDTEPTLVTTNYHGHSAMTPFAEDTRKEKTLTNHRNQERPPEGTKDKEERHSGSNYAELNGNDS